TKTITPRALAALQAYHWPGNVRELRNLMERLVLLTPARRVTPEELPEEIRSGVRAEAIEGASLDDARRAFGREFLRERLREHGWTIWRTAEAIGLARESLSRKMRQFGIRAPRE